MFPVTEKNASSGSNVNSFIVGILNIITERSKMKGKYSQYRKPLKF